MAALGKYHRPLWVALCLLLGAAPEAIAAPGRGAPVGRGRVKTRRTADRWRPVGRAVGFDRGAGRL